MRWTVHLKLVVWFQVLYEFGTRLEMLKFILELTKCVKCQFECELWDSKFMAE